MPLLNTLRDRDNPEGGSFHAAPRKYILSGMPNSSLNKLERFTVAAFAVSQVPLLLSIPGSKGVIFPLCLLPFVAACYLMYSARTAAPLVCLLDKRILAGYFFAFLAAWTALFVVDYYAVEYNNFDTGIFANLLAQLWQSGRYYSSVLQMHGLGDHFTPLLMMFAPLLALKSTFMWLPFIKLLAFFACPVILYRIAVAVLGRGTPLVYAPPLLWIMNKYAGKALEMEFQPSSLALPLVLLVFLFLIEGRLRLAWLPLVLLLGLKEHLPLIWISAGLFAAVVLRRRAWGLAAAAAGIALGWLIYFKIMPAFAGAAPLHAARFAPFTFPAAKIGLLLKAFASVGFIPLLYPRSLVFVLPAFAIQLISKDEAMLSLSFHYQDIAMPVLFVALTYGLKALQQCEYPLAASSARLRTLEALLSAVLIVAVNNRYPMHQIRRHWPTAEERAVVRELKALKAELSNRRYAVLWSLDALGPYLFEDERLRSIFTPADVLNEKAAHAVVVAEEVNKYPLTTQQLEELMTALEERIEAGKYERLTGFSRVKIFVSLTAASNEVRDVPTAANLK